MRSIDSDLLKAFALKVWKYKQGELVSLMVHLGNQLGLYEALGESGPATSEQLALATELNERWVREWLLGQAAAGLVERSEEGVFELGPEAREVLVNDTSLSFAGAAFGGGETPAAIAATLRAFETGRGQTYADLGEDVAEQLDRQSAPWLQKFLPERVLPELEGVVEALDRGAAVADIGCGGGLSTEAIAQRYPNSTVVGLEPSSAAIGAARSRLADLPNASVDQAFGEDLDGDYDLVMTLDCMHDAPFPDRIAAAIHGSLKSNGTWLIKDMRSAPQIRGQPSEPGVGIAVRLQPH